MGYANVNCFDEFYEGWEFTVEPMDIDRVEFMGKLFSGSNTREVIYFLEEKAKTAAPKSP